MSLTKSKPFVIFLAQMCPSSGIKRMVSESGDLIPLKRERFTFKGSHLAVLEQYYEQDPYPDAQVREMIVEECNKAAEKCGKYNLLFKIIYIINISTLSNNQTVDFSAFLKIL